MAVSGSGGGGPARVHKLGARWTTRGHPATRVAEGDDRRFIAGRRAGENQSEERATDEREEGFFLKDPVSKRGTERSKRAGGGGWRHRPLGGWRKPAHVLICQTGAGFASVCSRPRGRRAETGNMLEAARPRAGSGLGRVRVRPDDP